MSLLETYGWSPFFAASFEAHAAPGRAPARVVAAFKHLYRVVTAEGESSAEIAGRLRHEAKGPEDFPAVGDFVVVAPRPGGERVTIQAVLPRRGRLSRKAAGSVTSEQVLAANIDTLFLVAGLDGDFNTRRLERTLVLAWDSGAEPVLLLSKADLSPDVEGRVAQVHALAPAASVVAVSARDGQGLETLQQWLRPGQTVTLLGSSGVGKSTLINFLLGRDAQRTAAVREGDDRGRHTTTHRALFITPSGALLLDTPGMRELQLWDADEGLGAAFADVEALAAGCRFNDCAHDGTPGCAVEAAVEEGALAPGRLASFLKLQRELRQIRMKKDEVSHLREKQRIKALVKAADRFRPRQA